MSQPTEILLGSNTLTMYSDETWYLIVGSNVGEVVLESRFNTDSANRTGYPPWRGTEFCVFAEGDNAVCRIPYSEAVRLMVAERPSFVPAGIWAKAVEECKRLKGGGG